LVADRSENVVEEHQLVLLLLLLEDLDGVDVVVLVEHGGEDEEVLLRAAVEEVVAVHPDEVVGTAAALEVVARPGSEQHIVAGPALDRATGGKGGEKVGFAGALDGLFAGIEDRPPDVVV